MRLRFCFGALWFTLSSGGPPTREQATKKEMELELHKLSNRYKEVEQSTTKCGELVNELQDGHDYIKSNVGAGPG